MKDLILILAAIIALGSTAYDHKVTIPALTTDRDALRNELAESDHRIEQLTKTVDDLTDQLSQQEPEPAGEAPVINQEPSTKNQEPAKPTEPQALLRRPTGPTLAQRLASLETQHREKRATLDAKLAVLTRNRADTVAKRAALINNPPQFQELNTKTLPDGRVVTTGGVKTSQADRDKANAVHQSKIAEYDRHLTAIDEAANQIAADYRTLETNYQSAIAQARASH